jgi:hypothetical protein
LEAVRVNRRTFLTAAGLAPLAASAAEAAPVARFPFDVDFRNTGEWGGSITTFGPAPGEPLLEQRDGSGVVDFTRDWFQVQGGRLLYDNPKIVEMDSFAASFCFHPRRIGASATLLTRLSQWSVYLTPTGILTVRTYYSRTATQSLVVSSVALLDTWYQIAISFDRPALRLHFAFRHFGSGEPAKTGSFILVPGTMGPETDRTRRLLDFGATVGAEKFYGYMDNAVLWDRVMTPAELAARLDADAPSIQRIGLGGFDRYLMPLERDAQIALPNRSDVCMSSRWWHPQGASDSNDTMRDLRAFGATRLEWIYDSTAPHIRQVKDAGIRYIATINGNDSTPGRRLSVRDFAGEWAGYSWMITFRQADGLPPGAGCVNNPGFRDQQVRGIREALANGADGIQYDDWASNYGVFFSAGECLCEYCIAKFRTYLRDNRTPDELAAWSLGDLSVFDYRRYLSERKGIASQTAYLQFARSSPTDPLHAVYNRFQIASIRENLAALRDMVYAERLPDGRRPTLAVNSSVTQATQRAIAFAAADVPSYPVFEGSEDTVPGLIFYAKVLESLQKIGVMSPFPFVTDKTRSDIALRYAFGQLCLVPYDVWMQTSDLPRAYGTPAEYGDLFHFVREHAEMFDRMETVATVGIAIDTAKAEHGRLRPLMSALGEAAVPFVLLPFGRDYFAPAVPDGWKRRLPYLIDLSGLAEASRQFPNARLLSSNLTAEEMARIALVQIEAQGVVGSVRGSVADGHKTIAIHLVNRNLDEFGRVTPIEGFGVRLLQPEFWGDIGAVQALSPGAPAERAGIDRWGRGFRVTVPSVKTWTVLRIDIR